MTSSVPAPWSWIAAASLFLGQGAAKAPPVAPTPFGGRLAAAQELAVERNVPILVAAFYEGEEWTPEGHHDEVGMRRELFEQREWTTALERGVLVLACNSVHPSERVKLEVDGVQVESARCSAYRTPDCSAHQRLFEDVFNLWHDDGEMVTPFVVVLRPDGQVAWRWSDPHTPKREDLQGAFEAARKAIGAGLDERELVLVRGHEADARAAAARGEDGAAWRAWNALLALSQTTPAAARAREGAAAAGGRVAQRREAARATLAAGDAIAAWTALSELTAECAELPIHKELTGELRALENDPAHKPALRAHARELEAAGILAEIDALVREGELRKARGRCAKLLRGFGDTRAAAQARERHANLIEPAGG
jgi:hypothetical protein